MTYYIIIIFVTMLALVGILGLLMMTVIFPLLACLASQPCLRRWLFGKNPFFSTYYSTPNRLNTASEKVSEKPKSAETIKLHIVIPTHNEEATIANTLQSISKASANLTENFGGAFEVSITVVLDGCTDGTSKAIGEFNFVQVIEHPKALGKWQSIQDGCLAKGYTDWTVLIDAGSAWPDDLLSSLVCHLRDDDTVGIAPSYRNNNAKFLERLSWAVERRLKAVENGAGGPISVHGATVFYRTPALCDAFGLLSGKAWLNDDVVIPLAIRSLFPFKKLTYLPKIIVEDISPIRTGSESTRRVRLVRGNLDWVRESFWRHSPVVQILALRRISRMAWAYWFIGLISPLLLLGLSGVIVFVLIFVLFKRNAAFNASLKVIYLLGKSQIIAWR